MKGIHLQFQNLINHIQKNADSKQIVQNKDSFSLFYQKITIQTFKIINLVFQDVLNDFLIKQSFNKLVKQLKKFISLKPSEDYNQQDDYYQNNSYNQIAQFMNNRKPVTQIDSMQRGDIYRFLSQAESKQKDIAQFIENLNKINLKGSKKYLISNQKLKQTANNSSLQTLQEGVQTELTMKIFERVQTILPNIFNLQIKPNSISQNQENKTDKMQVSSIQQQILNKINSFLKQKIEQDKKNQAIATQLLQQENQKLKSNKNNQNQKLKKKHNKRVSELNSNNKRIYQFNTNKRSSQLNAKKNNKPSQINKNKSIYLVQKTLNQEQKHLVECSSQRHQLQTVEKDQKQEKQAKSIGTNKLSKQTLQKIIQEDNYQKYNNQKSKKISSLSLQKLIQALPEKERKQALNRLQEFKKQCMKNQKRQTLQKETNTENESFMLSNSTNNKDQKSKSKSRSKQIKFKQRIQNLQNKVKIEETNKDARSYNFSSKQSQSCRESFQSKTFEGQKQKQAINSAHLNQQIKQSSQFKDKNTKFFKNQKSEENNFKILSNNLPPINQRTLKSVQKNTTNKKTQLLKEKLSPEDYFKKIRDIKTLKPTQIFEPASKQNHSLDMYKAKKDLITKFVRGSEHTNLPSLNRNATSKGFMSLHQDIQDQKSPDLKKFSKKHPLIENLDAQNLSQMNEQQLKQYMIRTLKNKGRDFTKDEQIIMIGLQKISKQNIGKSHLRNINLYIKYIESIHHNRCGQKCIHLQRFYDFLNKRKLANRKQLTLHKTDINNNIFL